MWETIIITESLVKVETTERGIEFVLNCTDIECVAVGTALIVDQQHAGTVAYLARGAIYDVTADDVVSYNTITNFGQGIGAGNKGGGLG